MNRKKQLIIKKTATLKNTLLLGLLFLIMAFFIMPEASKQIKQYAPQTDLIDDLFYYFPDQVFNLVEAYGEKGRKLYIVVELTADLVFSIFIAAFFSSLLVWSASRCRDNSIAIKYLLLLPFLSMLANWLENGGIIWMLSRYPEKYFFLALITSFFTFSKWMLTIICLCIAGWNLFKLFFKNFHLPSKKQENTIVN